MSNEYVTELAVARGQYLSQISEHLERVKSQKVTMVDFYFNVKALMELYDQEGLLDNDGE